MDVSGAEAGNQSPPLPTSFTHKKDGTFVTPSSHSNIENISDEIEQCIPPDSTDKQTFNDTNWDQTYQEPALEDSLLQTILKRPRLPVLKLSRLVLPVPFVSNMDSESDEGNLPSSSHNKTVKTEEFRFVSKTMPQDQEQAPEKKKKRVFKLKQVEELLAATDTEGSDVSVEISMTESDTETVTEEPGETSVQASSSIILSTKKSRKQSQPVKVSTIFDRDPVIPAHPIPYQTVPAPIITATDTPVLPNTKVQSTSTWIPSSNLTVPNCTIGRTRDNCLIIRLPPMAPTQVSQGAIRKPFTLPVFNYRQQIPNRPRITQVQGARELIQNGGFRTAIPVEKPNLKSRLQLVESLIVTSGSSWTPEEIEKNTPDYWSDALSALFAQMRLGHRLTKEECLFYRDNSSILYARYMTRLQLKEAEHYCISTSLSQERAVQRTESDPNTNICASCEITHPDLEQCASHTSNGPRITSSLSASWIWRQEAEAVIIGTSGLFYQPPQGRGQFLNLSDTPNRNYRVQFSSDDLDVSQETHYGLYSTLLEKLQLLGANAGLPVFVEYYSNTNFADKEEHHHICGFILVLKALQKNYHSPIILVIGPSKPTINETEIAYSVRKIILQRTIKLARVLGWALQHPVISIQIQSLPMMYPLHDPKRHTWKDEVLFSEHNHCTREYYSRIYTWFRDMLLELKPNLLTPPELFRLNIGLTQ